MQSCEKAPATLAEALALVADQATTIRLLQLQIDQLNHRLFGPTSEKFPLEDRQLPLLAELFQNPEPPVAREVLVDPVAKPRRPAVRQPVPAALEPADKSCPHCGQECHVIREDRSDKFDLVPARLVCHRTIRPVLACPRCKEGVKQAPMPPAIVAKGVCSDALIAYVICAKYLDHRPLYRVQQEFLRLGANISRPVLSDAVAAAALALQPLWRLIGAGLAGGDYLQVDETPVNVLDPEVKGKAAKGWLWVYHRPGGDVFFDFRTGRDRARPAELLKDFHGTLQSDGYSVYEALGNRNPEWKRLGCLAHARRKFHEALGDQPEWAKWFLRQMGQLYLIERQLREAGAGPAQRLARRQQDAKPVLATIHQKLVELEPAVLPKSPLGKAVRYALGQWEYLQAYVEDGRYEIDQNLVENALRPSCVGKKNWLFIGHPDAGWRSAVLYTMIINCRRHNLDPLAWLTDVFQRLPAATNKTVGELLPSRWKKPEG